MIRLELAWGLGLPAAATAGTGEASCLGVGVSLLPSDRKETSVLVPGLPKLPLDPGASRVPSLCGVGVW